MIITFMIIIFIIIIKVTALLFFQCLNPLSFLSTRQACLCSMASARGLFYLGGKPAYTNLELFLNNSI